MLFTSTIILLVGPDLISEKLSLVLCKEQKNTHDHPSAAQDEQIRQQGKVVFWLGEITEQKEYEAG